MNGCIYRTKDGECDLYAEGGKYTAFCEMENCVGRKMSNADRIRSMTDDELASVLLDERCSFCDANNYSVCNSTKRCHEEIEAWLRAEVSE